MLGLVRSTFKWFVGCLLSGIASYFARVDHSPFLDLLSFVASANTAFLGLALSSTSCDFLVNHPAQLLSVFSSLGFLALSLHIPSS